MHNVSCTIDFENQFVIIQADRTCPDQLINPYLMAGDTPRTKTLGHVPHPKKGECTVTSQESELYQKTLVYS